MHVLIADDHELFRTGLNHLLLQTFPDASVVEAAGLDEALALLSELPHVDLIVLDLQMPGVDGAASISALCDAFPNSRVVIMSASEESRDIFEALSTGIQGYVPKSMPGTEIAAALQRVMEGNFYVPKVLAMRRPVLAEPRDKAAAPQGLDHLTIRQRNVLDELMLGKSSKEIGRALDLAEGTIKIHLAAIYRALGVKSRAEAFVKMKGAG